MKTKKWQETGMSVVEMGNTVLAVAVKDQWCFRGDTFTDNLPSYQAIADRQAKLTGDIAFKAGQEDGLLKGIQKVVEWIESVPTREIDGAEQYICTLEQWQSKLKEWGIK